MRRFLASLAVASVLALSAIINAQTGGVMPAHQPRANLSGPLPKHPVQAHFEREGQAIDSGTWVSAIYRDARGSVRTDMTVGEKQLIFILDAPTQKLILLDATAHTAIASSYPAMASAEPMWSYDVSPQPTGEHRKILGIDCEKFLVSDIKTHAPAGEMWIAEDLGLVLEDRQPTAQGVVTWRATTISFDPPDEALFAIPKGYKVMSNDMIMP